MYIYFAFFGEKASLCNLSFIDTVDSFSLAMLDSLPGLSLKFTWLSCLECVSSAKQQGGSARKALRAFHNIGFLKFSREFAKVLRWIQLSFRSSHHKIVSNFSQKILLGTQLFQKKKKTSHALRKLIGVKKLKYTERNPISCAD